MAYSSLLAPTRPSHSPPREHGRVRHGQGSRARRHRRSPTSEPSHAQPTEAPPTPRHAAPYAPLRGHSSSP
jgi:hypothetical protein